MQNEITRPQWKVYTNSALADSKAIRESTKRLLMITDFSQNAEHAEGRAAMLSMELNNQPLEIMAIGSGGSGTDSGSHRLVAIGDAKPESVGNIESGLRDVAHRLSKWEKLAYICSIRFGNPVSGIVDRAEEMDAFVTVIGSYGGTIATNLTRGYSTIDVVRAVTRPVLVVKQEPLESYRKVLIATDFSEASLQAARVAMTLAPQAEFELLHVIEDSRLMTISSEVETNESRVERRIEEDEAAKFRLAQLVPELKLDAGQVSLVVRHGFPSGIVHARAREIGADLVAYGKVSCSDGYNQTLGSVAMGLLVQSTCDVLMACETGDGGGDTKPAA